MQYEGPAGAGSLRLVLRLRTAVEFQLAAADVLGRSVWSLEVDGEALLLLDHRRRLACRTREEIAIPEPVLATLPLTALPRVLLGQLPQQPGDPAELGGERFDFVDREGLRWSGRRDPGSRAIEAWTLWREEAPVVWWTRQAGGGILSHRDGAQFRWRRSLSEALTDWTTLAVPPGFESGRCDEADLSQLREDQPAPAGDRPAL